MKKRVGVLGGGQLGLMLVEAANPLGIQVNILDVGNSPAKRISARGVHLDGSFKDPVAIAHLASGCDVVTVEIEHVDTHAMERVAQHTDVQPKPHTIRIIQDKFLQKQHLEAHGVATAKAVALETSAVESLESAIQMLGLPLMLKSRREAYDGKGNYPVRTLEDFAPALKALGGNGDLYAEEWADFEIELAVMIVKTHDNVLAFPVVETVHENSICKLVYAPARYVSPSILTRAQDLAKKAVASFNGKGVFGVEMFLLRDGSLLVNEIAPRPHNSGHYTIEGCEISQYEAHLRAILDMPIQQESLRLREPAIMLNILGGDQADSHERFMDEALKHRVRMHDYGKDEARPGRKMGHVTVVAPSMSKAEVIMQPLIDFVDRNKSSRPGLRQPKPPTSTPVQPKLQQKEAEQRKPLVAVIMGSISDRPVLVPCTDLLDQFAIPYVTRIVSAHRTPDLMRSFAQSATDQGLHLIIAAAGGAAHLPGMTAAYTGLPVIGIPVKPSIGDGWDSLVSMTNMPRGVPVATVGINNGVNAALLAARMLGMTDEGLRRKVNEYARQEARKVEEQNALSDEKGAEE